MRLEVEGVRDSPGTARLVEQTLRAIPGMRAVTVDPGTGAISLSYEPCGAGMSIPVPAPPARRVVARHARPAATGVAWIAQTIVVVALEMALQRFLGPLFLPRRC
jgi:hypothetical protein